MARFLYCLKYWESRAVSEPALSRSRLRCRFIVAESVLQAVCTDRDSATVDGVWFEDYDSKVLQEVEMVCRVDEVVDGSEDLG